MDETNRSNIGTQTPILRGQHEGAHASRKGSAPRRHGGADLPGAIGFGSRATRLVGSIPSAARACALGSGAAYALATLVGLTAQIGIASASADDRWFVGGEILATEQRFDIDVEYTYGRASDDFTDTVWGMGASLIGGRQIGLSPDWSVSIQGRLLLNEADWTLATPRTDVRYRMPSAVALSLLPEYRLTEQFSIFGELGAAIGQFDYRKRSSAPDRITFYDDSSSAPGYVLGVGLRFAISPQLDVHATYRYSDYESQRFLGQLSDGTVREIFTSDPTLQEVGIGMRWSW